MSYRDSLYPPQYEQRPEISVTTILDNLSRGGVQPDYASQWASYFRSQGMSREADMIETYERGLDAGRGGGGGYGSAASCHRCGKSGHYARECREDYDLRDGGARDYDAGPRNFACRDGKDCKFLKLAGGCRYQHDGVKQGAEAPVINMFPCKDGDDCKFLKLPGGCRYKHEGVEQQASSGAIVCYRCSGVGHFSRDCPTFTGVRRDAPPRGGGPMRRVTYPPRDAFRGRGVPPGAPVGRGRGVNGDYGSGKCNKCNRYGHFARDCREVENRCYKCSESGHLAKDCDEPDLCYVCNQDDHLAKDCPDGDKKTCYKCTGKGHVALDCPSKFAPVGRRSPKLKRIKRDSAGDEDAREEGDYDDY